MYVYIYVCVTGGTNDIDKKNTITIEYAAYPKSETP